MKKEAVEKVSEGERNLWNSKYLLVFVFIFFNLVYISSVQASNFTFSPGVAFVNSSTESIRFLCDSSCNATVYWGLTQSYGANESQNNSERFHEFNITNLLEETQYYYKVYIENTTSNSSYNASFVTANDSKTSFSFVVIGDTRNDCGNFSAITTTLFSSINNDNPDFVLIVGDNVEVTSSCGDNESIELTYSVFDDILEPVFNHTPIFGILGNHDVNNNMNSVEGRNGLYYHQLYWMNPHNGNGSTNAGCYQSNCYDETTYYFRYGNSLFVVLNTEEPVNSPRISGDQLDWLNQTLQLTGYTNKFVFAHRPLLLSRNTGTVANDYPDDVIMLQNLFKENNATAVFVGHDHAFCSGNMFNRSVIHFITGGGGAPLHTETTCKTDDAEALYHYMIVNVSDSNVTFKKINSTGTVLKEYDNSSVNKECGIIEQSINLTSNSSANGSCIFAGTSDIIFDCASYSIKGNGSGRGIFNMVYDNFTIKNCEITNFTTGVYYQTNFIANNVLEDSEIHACSDGIAFGDRQTNLSILSNTIYDCSDSGIDGLYGGGFNVFNNTIVNNSNKGINTAGTYCRGNISQNYFSNNTNYDIYLGSGGNNLVLRINDNTIENSSLGIYLYATPIVLIYNNTIRYNSNFGIQADRPSSNISIYNNSIYGNGDDGIFFGRYDDSEIYDNIIYDNSGHGLHLREGANNNSIYNNNIYNNTGTDKAGIYIDEWSSNAPTNNNFTNNTLQNNYYGVYIDGTSTNNTIKDTMITDSTNLDIYNVGDSSTTTNNTFINMTYNKSKVTITNLATLFFKWYLDVYVNDTNGNSLNAANVSCWDKNNNPVFTALTNSSGHIARKSLAEYHQNSSTFYYYTNHTTNATKTGYSTGTKQVNLTSSSSIVITLQESPTMANLTIWDSTNSTTKYVNDSINFYANFTNITSGESINGSGVYCNISFNVIPQSPFDMPFNPTSLLYEYNRSFNQSGTFVWNVTCSGTAQGYDELNTTDLVFISSGDYFGNDFVISGIESIWPLDNESQKTSLRFTAHETKTIDRIFVYINEKVGDNITWSVGLQADSSGFPSGNWLGGGNPAKEDIFINSSDMWLGVNLTNNYQIQAGTVYHIVVNYSSGTTPNETNYIALRRTTWRRRYPYDNSVDNNMDCLVYNGQYWYARGLTPVYSFQDTDGNYGGNPYHSSADATVSGNDSVGQYLKISGGNKTIYGLAFYIRRYYLPDDDVYYEIRNVDDPQYSVNEVIRNGTLATNDDWEYGYYNSFLWQEANLSSSLTLKDGYAYRFVMNSPDITNSGTYTVRASYSFTSRRGSSYGGESSDYSSETVSSDGGNSWSQYQNNDIGFKLLLEPISQLDYSNYSKQERPLVPGQWNRIGGGGLGHLYAITIDPNNSSNIWIGGDNSGTQLSEDMGVTWESRNNGMRRDSGFRHYKISVKPGDSNIVLTATNSGVFKTTDKGRNWLCDTSSEVNSSQSFRSVAYAPSNGSVAYAGGRGNLEGEIWKTTGSSWSKVNTGFNDEIPTDAEVHHIAIDPNNESIVYAATDKGLYKSIDGGLNFSHKNNGIPNQQNESYPYVRYVTIAPSNSSIIYINLWSKNNEAPWLGGVYKSTDGGETWRPKIRGLPQGVASESSNYVGIAIHPTNPNIVYTTQYYSSPSANVLKSTDGGETWSTTMVPYGAGKNSELGYNDKRNWRARDIAIDSTNPNNIYMPTTRGAFRSYDAGQTWYPMYTTPIDSTSTKHNGFDSSVPERVKEIGNKTYLLYADLGKLLWTEDLSTWQFGEHVDPENIRDDVNELVGDPNDSNKLYVAYGTLSTTSYLARSTDGGNTWTMINGSFPITGGHVEAMIMVDSDTIVVGKGGGCSYTGIYRTTNAQDNPPNWTKVNDIGNHSIRSIIQRPGDSNTLYVATDCVSGSGNPGVFRSTDKGLNWTQLNDTSASDIDVIAGATVNNDTIFFSSGTSNAIYKSTDGGQNWIEVLNSSGITSIQDFNGVKIDTTNTSIVYAGGRGYNNTNGSSYFTGVYRSLDGGITWEKFNDNCINCEINRLEMDSKGNLYAITPGYGAWAYLSTPIVSLVSPANSSTWSSSSTVTFNYNVNDASSISNCSLLINNAIDQTDTSITKDTTQPFSKSLSNANYNWSVRCYDSVNNQGDSSVYYLTVSYTAGNGDNGGGGGGGGTTTQSTQEIYTGLNITPGIPTIIKDFDPEIGIKQIQIEVNTPVQGVRVTITKHSDKPAEVTKDFPIKEGKVYKYLQIQEENINKSLDKATITIQVEKNWTSENNVERDDMAMFKFNESYEVWNELETIYIEENETYYYYNIELDSFSYFAIAGKVVEEPEVGEEIEIREKIREIVNRFIEVIKPYWLWILIGVGSVIVIVVGIIVFSKIRKEGGSFKKKISRKPGTEERLGISKKSKRRND